MHLTISPDHNCLTDIHYQPCKIPAHSPLPERQMRLKVKDSIGGVSLQDTSQGEKATCNKSLIPLIEIPSISDPIDASLEEQLNQE